MPPHAFPVLTRPHMRWARWALLVTGLTGTFGHVRTSDSVKIMYEASIEELDTRSMSLQTPHISQHITFQTHVQQAVFSRARERRRHSEARARIGTRGGVRVAFGTVSTVVKRSFNGVARGSGRVKVLGGHPALLHTNRCRLILSWRTRSRSRVCSDASATLTVARGRSLRSPLSRWRWTRSKRASRSVFLDGRARATRAMGRKGSCCTPYYDLCLLCADSAPVCAPADPPLRPGRILGERRARVLKERVAGDVYTSDL